MLRKFKRITPKPKPVLAPGESSHISKVDYHGTTLTVTFKNGARYEFANVPRETYAALSAAESRGRHFHRFIKNNHAGRKL